MKTTVTFNDAIKRLAQFGIKYPYGLTERFTAEEKACYHKIQEILGGET